MKKLLVLFVALAMIASVSATSPFTNGWGDCNTAGNYGGWDKVSTCKVAWDGACTSETKDATFTVDTGSSWLAEITIEHLNGIAETMDGFEVKDASGAVVCTFTDAVAGPGEVWETFHCIPTVQTYSGVQVFTLHPLAVTAWSSCGTYGQVAISSIVAVPDGQVPEFGVIAGVVALVGALGIFLYRRH
jgi:hypothetical protein